MQSDIFENWFEETLIPNFKQNSVIVLDNAAYHSRLVEKIPNKSSKKLDIQKCLERRDLYYEESYTKSELLEVLNTRQWEKKYIVDQIAKKYGHTVLRLPPYYCVFNPNELIWGQLKRRIRKRNRYPKFGKRVVDLIKEEVTHIGENECKKCLEKVMKYEDEYRSSNPICFEWGILAYYKPK
nr:unnamed protein product [Callosobruchus chinensis]